MSAMSREVLAVQPQVRPHGPGPVDEQRHRRVARIVAASRTAAGSGATSRVRSPSVASRSRLVARITRPGHPLRSVGHHRANPVEQTCSQLSRTNSASLSARKATTESTTRELGRSLVRRARSPRPARPTPGLRTGASSHQKTPSTNRLDASAADAQRETRLPDAAHAGDGDQSRLVQGDDDRLDVRRATEEARQLRRQPGPGPDQPPHGRREPPCVLAVGRRQTLPVELGCLLQDLRLAGSATRRTVRGRALRSRSSR